MTSNQIAYWSLVENSRANQTRENETRRTNLENERIKWFSNWESARHNKSNEGISIANLAETARHNQFTENESKRHNVQDEFLKRYGIDSSYAANIYGVDMNRRNTLDTIAANKDIAAKQIAQQDLNSQRQYLSSIYSTNVRAYTDIWKTNQELDTRKQIADLNAQTSIYSADQHYKASKYSADSSRDTAKYVANKNYSSQDNVVHNQNRTSWNQTKYNADRNEKIQAAHDSTSTMNTWISSVVGGLGSLARSFFH